MFSTLKAFVVLSALVVMAGPAVVSAEKTDKDEPIGELTYRLSDGSEDWPEAKRTKIVNAMDEAVALYNKHARFKKELRISYNPDVPTADANYNGHIRFGGSISTRTALHEISHTLGVGTTKAWRKLLVDGEWTGTRASKLIQEFDGEEAVVNGDRQHFWPYGLNFPREDGAEKRIRHIRIVEALARDMELPVTLPEPKKRVDR